MSTLKHGGDVVCIVERHINVTAFNMAVLSGKKNAVAAMLSQIDTNDAVDQIVKSWILCESCFSLYFADESFDQSNLPRKLRRMLDMHGSFGAH
jgi:hypothetical protein